VKPGIVGRELDGAAIARLEGDRRRENSGQPSAADTDICCPAEDVRAGGDDATLPVSLPQATTPASGLAATPAGTAVAAA
jgi:hypothetical protein